jgi:thiamine pyrophosphokinase
MAKAVLIALSGEASDEDFRLAADCRCKIAVDGGLRHFINRGLIPDIHLGDFDSTDKMMQDFAQKHCIRQLQFPIEKNESDGELAIMHARAAGFQKAFLVGLQSVGRPDHVLFNFGLIRYGNDVGIETVAISSGFLIFEVTERKEIKSEPGMIFSVLPQDGACHVRLSGLKYPLDGALMPGSTLGLSNETLGDFTVETDGRLLAFLQVSCLPA